MTWTSYAQNFEDVVLARVLADVAEGFYVDAGAQDPRMDSVTLAFYERGWRGINLEPVAHWHARLAQARPRDVNLAVAAGAAPGELAFFEVAGSGLSTASAAFAERHRAAGHAVHARRVPVQTLDAICAEHAPGPIHFLKVDVEGAEKDVLAGIDLARTRPWVVLVEATEPNSRARNHADWEPLLTGRGYRFAYDDGVNRFYLAEEHAALAERFGPPTVLDDFVRREQVDAVAEVEARLADVDALSHRRAADIEGLVAAIAGKDAALAEAARQWDGAVAREAELRADIAWRVEDTERRQAEYDRLGREHAEQGARLQGELERLAAEHAAQGARLQAELERLAAEHAAQGARLQAEIDQLVAANTTLAEHLDATARQAQAIDAELVATRASAEAARIAVEAARTAERLAAEARIAELSRRVPELEAAAHAAEAAHAAAHAELLRHVGLIDALRVERDQMLASRSWRLTAPLRAANRVLARLRGRPAAAPAAAPDHDAAPAAPPLALSEDAERLLAHAPLPRGPAGPA